MQKLLGTMAMSQMIGEDCYLYNGVQALRFGLGTNGSSAQGVRVSGTPDLLTHSRRRQMAYLSVGENTKMNDCFFEEKDWRKCQAEVRRSARLSIALLDSPANTSRIY